MVSSFYNENGPVLFDGLEEEEPPVRNNRRMLFPGGILGPLGYMGQTFPFMMGGPIPADMGDVEEEDPNP